MSQHMDVSTSRVESFNTQQRMEIDLNTEPKLPNISEELNVSQHSTAMADSDQQIMPTLLSKTNTKQIQKNRRIQAAKYRSFVVLNDLSKNND